jgi:flagellar P-ring protein FlgI
MRMRLLRNLGFEKLNWIAATTAALFLIAAASAQAERVKDLASVQGVRGNQLVGYGLVVGLAGTGDQTSQAPFTIQSIKNMLVRYGVTIPANANPQLKNVAAVTVHADLPAFAKTGQAIDVTVSSIGNAGSLRGGSLIMTPLRGADGEVYAIAQGSLIVGGFGIAAKDGSSISVNIPSAGRVPNGATVEREVPNSFTTEPFVMLNLHVPDFTTSARLTEGINKLLGDGTAQSVDSVSVKVVAPADASQRTSYLATLEAIEIEPGDAPARVIINSRTGTVVIGSHVRVMPAAVSHGSLTVTITERAGVSQPNEFGQGQTVIVPQSSISVSQPAARMFVFDAGVDLNDIVRAVNQVGAAPGDLVAILEALKQSGALRAELIVI